MATPPVLLITLSTCGYCADAKEFFRQRGITPTVIEFDSVSLELKRQIAADMRQSGVPGFPFVKIGGVPVAGFDPDVYDQLLREKSSGNGAGNGAKASAGRGGRI